MVALPSVQRSAEVVSNDPPQLTRPCRRGPKSNPLPSRARSGLARSDAGVAVL